MTLGEIDRAAARDALEVFGALDGGEEAGTIVLLGPREPGFWAALTASPEWADGLADPVDRWSARVIGALAGDLGAEARFPFGKPYQPFVRWALACGRVWQSPSGLMVHDRAGLMFSLRGALLFADRFAPTRHDAVSPCERCTDKPCLSACPAGALDAGGYDVPACHAWLDANAAGACMNGGCLARRACPLSQAYSRLPEQSAHHMSYFHRSPA